MGITPLIRSAEIVTTKLVRKPYLVIGRVDGVACYRRLCKSKRAAEKRVEMWMSGHSPKSFWQPRVR